MNIKERVYDITLKDAGTEEAKRRVADLVTFLEEQGFEVDKEEGEGLTTRFITFRGKEVGKIDIGFCSELTSYEDKLDEIAKTYEFKNGGK
jgi:hypothetical protein